MKLWHLGLPLGSSFLAAALLDSIVAFYWLLIDGGSLIYFHWEHDVPLKFPLIFGLVCYTIKFILALSIWTFVFMGCRSILIFWIPLSVINDLLIFIHAIRHQNHNLSDEVWFLNLACVFFFRFYITAVVSQCLVRLSRNEISLTNIEDQLPNSKYAQLEPVGNDIASIWQYYYNSPSLGAHVLLVVEIVWNIFCLSTHCLTDFLLGGRIFLMPKEEETMIRIWRIFLDIAALIFVLHRNKTMLRFWLIFYLWTLFVSLCIYVYMMVEWALDVPYVMYCVTFYLFLGDNTLRATVLFFCLNVTTVPEEQISRKSSLRSSRSASSRNSRSLHLIDN